MSMSTSSSANSRVPQVEARANELTIRPSWRTGICRMVMKVRNCASVPTLISPAITFSPPNHSTSPMAAKNEKFMALVLPTRMSTRCLARSSASCLARSNFCISWRCAAKARTTRMPPRFSSITRLSTDSRSCSVSQVLLSASWVTEDRQATNGTKLRLSSPSTRSVLISR